MLYSNHYALVGRQTNLWPNFLHCQKSAEKRQNFFKVVCCLQTSELANCVIFSLVLSSGYIHIFFFTISKSCINKFRYSD
jgi:hypothetical protein